MKIDLKQGDCLELMKQLPDCSVDLIFCDPPYNLSSQVYIKENGKPDLKKAKDFMEKWNGLDGEFLEEFHKECKRVLKHGGHCLLFGIDRQLFMFEYYANLAGFTQKQSLYWYTISGFPKATDLSKQIDKHFGAERKVVVENTKKTTWSNTGVNLASNGEDSRNITAPSTPLAKKYEGIKYSVAPLKQTNETIMVFQKPYKTGSCMHDVLAMENGDDSITCGGMDIENNRVGVENTTRRNKVKMSFTPGIWSKEHSPYIAGSKAGRFPPQTFVNSEAGEVIDRQSGVLKSDNISGVTDCKMGTTSTFGANNNQKQRRSDSGGASKILHRCDFEAGDYDLYFYNPKVSKAERNKGLEGFEKRDMGTMRQGKTNDLLDKFITEPAANNHPTVKPKALLSKILKLFKTPNKQILLDPFMGSGSMGISAVETGFDYIGYELDKNYFKIAQSRIKHSKDKADARLF